MTDLMDRTGRPIPPPPPFRPDPLAALSTVFGTPREAAAAATVRWQAGIKGQYPTPPTTVPAAQRPMRELGTIQHGGYSPHGPGYYFG